MRSKFNRWGRWQKTCRVYFSPVLATMATNVLIELINSIFGNVMAGVTTLLAGSTGQVIVGFTSIALLLALIVYVRKTFSGSKA